MYLFCELLNMLVWLWVRDPEFAVFQYALLHHICIVVCFLYIRHIRTISTHKLFLYLILYDKKGLNQFKFRLAELEWDCRHCSGNFDQIGGNDAINQRIIIAYDIRWTGRRYYVGSHKVFRGFHVLHYDKLLECKVRNLIIIEIDLLRTRCLSLFNVSTKFPD